MGDYTDYVTVEKYDQLKRDRDELVVALEGLAKHLRVGAGRCTCGAWAGSPECQHVTASISLLARVRVRGSR